MTVLEKPLLLGERCYMQLVGIMNKDFESSALWEIPTYTLYLSIVRVDCTFLRQDFLSKRLYSM